MSVVLITRARVLTMNASGDMLEADVRVEDGRIAAIGGHGATARPVDRTIDGSGCLLLPGLVQTHVHLCQTLFRGFADDLPLLEWLRTRIWPLEAAHTPTTLRHSTRLAAAELLLSGTTTVLSMETIHDTHVVFEALHEAGLRAVVGRCFMDRGDSVPARLLEAGRQGLDEALELERVWRARSNGRLRVALAPRFALSCSRGLLEDVAALAQDAHLLVHTHSSEQRDEVALVEHETGLRNIDYLAAVGLATPHLCAAHCIWVDDREQAVIAERGVKVLHCPSSNLKLGSGIAPIVELRARGVSVTLGTDGAACSNRLDMFDEMRMAASLQAMRRGPGALGARDVVWMATRGGAEALGLESEIGSVEVGKRADLILVDVSRVQTAPALDPYPTLVYAARGSDVRMTMVDGRVLVSEGRLVDLDAQAVAADARVSARLLGRAAGLS